MAEKKYLGSEGLIRLAANVLAKLQGYVPTSRTVNGKALSEDITLSYGDVGADQSGAAASALTSAKSYTDEQIESVTNGDVTVAEATHASTATSATSATTATSATKATQDASGNVIVDTYETKVDSAAKLDEAKSYADGIKNDLLNNAGEAYDTLKELGDLIDENTDAIDALNTVASGKADAVHTHAIADVTDLKSTIDSMQGEIDANESSISSAQTKLATIEEGAQVNVQPDWNENDETSAAYVKNRPFYTGDPVLITVVDNVTFTTTDYNGLGAAQRPFTLVLEEGVEYVVTWNGVDYTTTCTVMDGMLAIGNGSIFGMAADTGEPFIIGYAGSIMLYATSVGEVTITVKKNDVEIHKLSSKYIDFPLGSYVGELTDVGEIFNDYENNVASGSYSHAEGSYTEASGHWSHAEGSYTEASGQWSHAEGYATKARGQAQHVQGKYNIEDTAGDYAHIVGNGTSSVRANIHTLDWDGGAWYKGGIKVGGTSYADADEVATKAYVDANAGGQVQFITWESTD